MRMDAKQELAQRQTLSQAQVQSLSVLAMTGDELEQFVQREVEDNPLLEQPEYTEGVLPERYPAARAAAGRDRGSAAAQY